MATRIKITATASEDSNVPVTITIEAEDGQLTRLTGIGPDGQPCEVKLQVRYKKPAPINEAAMGENGDDDDEEGGDNQCTCCSPRPDGTLLCVTCPCPTRPTGNSD